MIFHIPTDELLFPPVHFAEESGLLGIGGDLSPERLLLAYRSGIFPWYNPEEPILWYSPDPRMVLFLENIRISHSMKKVLRQGHFTITLDKAFPAVMKACALIKRNGQSGTWIGTDIYNAYCRLHQMGYAHSVEVWEGETLVGGLYGVALGQYFCGESMFSYRTNASKAAFISLAQLLRERGFQFIDCQIYTPHLESLGAEEISRDHFLTLLQQAIPLNNSPQQWQNWLP